MLSAKLIKSSISKMESKTKKSVIKANKTLSKSDAFKLFESTGISKDSTPAILNHEQKLLIKSLIIKELEMMSDKTAMYMEDKVLNQSILGAYNSNKERLLEQIYLMINE